MIVQTKFHDVSYEEIRKRHPVGCCQEDRWENVFRGTEVSIIAVPVPVECFDEDRPEVEACGLTQFEMVGEPGCVVCAHLVEID